MQAAALVATSLLGIAGFFQLAVAFGAPWAKAAWGGRYEDTPQDQLRFVSTFIGLVVYPIVALYILVSAGVVQLAWLPGAGTIAMWILTGLFALATLGNLRSPSKVEKLWAILTAGLVACCAVIALAL